MPGLGALVNSAAAQAFDRFGFVDMDGQALRVMLHGRHIVGGEHAHPGGRGLLSQPFDPLAIQGLAQVLLHRLGVTVAGSLSGLLSGPVAGTAAGQGGEQQQAGGKQLGEHIEILFSQTYIHNGWRGQEVAAVSARGATPGWRCADSGLFTIGEATLARDPG